ncbi:MAG: hypothetical protein ACE37N_08880 [Pseudohongiellaceae bacterium]
MLIFLATLPYNGLYATSLFSLSIDEVAEDAELIFEGSVLSREARVDTASGIIYTYVTFSVGEVIKGNYSGEQLELRFTGGEVNGEIVEVSGLTLPAAGEQGIYFVESLYRDLVNPLLGWSQGHYLIVEQDGEQQITTNDRQPITSIQPQAQVPATLRRPQRIIDGKHAAATGVVTSNAAALSVERPLTPAQFKARIRALLEP